MDPDLDSRVDELYTLEPGEFVAARSDLAKQLRTDKQRDAAAEVAKLRRPTVVAWALNQLARSSPDDIEELLAAGATLREAQAGAVGGAGGAELRDAMRARRDVVRRLASQVVKLLGAETHRDDVVNTLEAASIDEAAGDILKRGRLSKELPAPGWLDVPASDAPAPSPSKKAASKQDEAKERRERERLEKERAKRSDAATKARAAADDAAADVTRLEKELGRARDKAEKAAAKADDADQHLAELEG